MTDERRAEWIRYWEQKREQHARCLAAAEAALARLRAGAGREGGGSDRPASTEVGEG